MEFTKLSEVEVVETATDNDKVLIEQNGEIKRVPKTEVGGGGASKALIIEVSADGHTHNANMTLSDAIVAFNSKELGSAYIYIPQLEQGNPQPPARHVLDIIMNGTPLMGVDILMLANTTMELQLFWTASGISTTPPA